jgi:hypothetical protein
VAFVVKNSMGVVKGRTERSPAKPGENSVQSATGLTIMLLFASQAAALSTTLPSPRQRRRAQMQLLDFSAIHSSLSGDHGSSLTHHPQHHGHSLPQHISLTADHLRLLSPQATDLLCCQNQTLPLGSQLTESITNQPSPSLSILTLSVMPNLSLSGHFLLHLKNQSFSLHPSLIQSLCPPPWPTLQL